MGVVPAKVRTSRERCAWSAYPQAAATCARGAPQRISSSARPNRITRARRLGPGGADRVDQVGLTVTVGAGGVELGAGCGLAVGVNEGAVVVAGVLAAGVGEVLALGVGNGFSGRGCVVRGC